MAKSLDVKVQASELIDAKKIQPMIMVFPSDGPTTRTDTEWMNSVTDATARWGSFVSSDLVRWVDSRYSVCRGRAATSIAGVSMGAFGAVNAAIDHLGEYGAVMSWSGYFVANTPKVNGPKGSVSWRNASPLYAFKSVLPKLRTLPLRISLYSARTDSDESETVAFARLLSSNGVPHRYALYNGPHDYVLWRAQFASQLEWLSSGMLCS